LTAELSGFRCCGSVSHLNLDGRAAFCDPGGANCPNWRPPQQIEHFVLHFDQLISRN
jgi:hypothetical protein